MTISPTPRKIFQGVADRHQMFRMFDRHAQRPTRFRGWMLAMREFLDQSVTSVFFALSIEEKIRHFHAYCDLSDHASVEHMRIAIIGRESRPARGMTREERLEHIWSTAAESYRGYCQRCDGARSRLSSHRSRDGGVFAFVDELRDKRQQLS